MSVLDTTHRRGESLPSSGYASYVDRARILGSMLAVATAVAVAGCSNANRHRLELRTPAQSSRFLASVARHGNVEDWALAPGASSAATRVWSEGAAIEDLGARIRREGGNWGCELAASSFRVGSVGVFSVGDRQSLANEAAISGAKDAQIKAFYSDILKMSMADLRELTASVCPNAYLG